MLHEATRSCGVGAEVAALIAEEAFEDLDGPVVRVTAPDSPIPFSPPLERAILPQVDDVKEACRELLSLLGVAEVTMPQMGVSVAEGTIVEWHKRVGDWVERDEVIVEISTDKVETEVPSPESGRVTEILVEVGHDRGRRDRAGADRCRARSRASRTWRRQEAEPAPSRRSRRSSAGSPPSTTSTCPRSTGTGRRGRVTKKDVLAFMEQWGERPEPVLHTSRPTWSESPSRRRAGQPAPTGRPAAVARCASRSPTTWSARSRPRLTARPSSRPT